MIKSLWGKFFILLLIVSLVGLSAAIYMRQMMISDFKALLEGERLDRVYLVLANLEGSYEADRGWNEGDLSHYIVLAVMMGMEVQVRDSAGVVVMDTQRALKNLPPLMARRVFSLTGGRDLTGQGKYSSYPLFLGGENIGTMEVRFLSLERGLFFLRRSRRFLVISFLIMGGIAVLASFFASRRLVRPLKRLVGQTRAISMGDLGTRAEITSSDEVGKLSHAFNEMADDLQLQDSLRRKLIANVAHELRTPLAAMRGELEGMIDGVIETDSQQVRSLYEETGRLGNLLDRIDDLTQAQASSLNLDSKPVELAGFLGNIRKRYLARAEEKGVRLETRVDTGTMAWADPDWLSQIVINLLENAIRATPRGGSVTLTGKQDASGTILKVSDDGKGIKAADLPLIFERFYRGSEGGLGLGLTIVKELVDAHGGEIEVHSEEGKGTRVEVTLPDKSPEASGKWKG